MPSRLISRLLDILYPPRLVCCACGREAVVGKSGFCMKCESELEPFLDAPILNGIDGYAAAVYYNSVAKNAVGRLKYGGNRFVAEYIAGLTAIPNEWAIDAVVPVPLHKTRYRERGFNQSELIARHICKRYDLIMRTDLVCRRTNTGRQTILNRNKRLKNLKGAFEAIKDCEGLSILLVDDVRTTGATLEECARALKAAGCITVYAVTVCFARSK